MMDSFAPKGRHQLNKTVAKPKVAADLQEALQMLIERSMRFGHRRLAIRRYLMMQSQGFTVLEPELSFCEELLQLCPGPELRRIRESVEQWAAMLNNPKRFASNSMNTVR